MSSRVDIADTGDAAGPEMRRNRWIFGVGTLGRDMAYTLVAFYLVFYLTDVLDVPDSTMWAVTVVLLVIRILDAILDPIVGALVDSTRSRWGQFRPWLALGGLISGVFTVLLFTDTQLTGTSFVVVFALVNLLWGIAWSSHDISYWGMLPALSLKPADRESLASTAKAFANVGQFAVVAAVPPVVSAISGKESGTPGAWQTVAIVVSVLMVVFMWVTILFVRERTDIDLDGQRTGIRELGRAIFGNDQLIWTATAFLLFMLGYGTTGAFGLYFFKYAYGDESVFPVFALCVGVGQIAGLISFPWFARRWPRRTIYGWATASMCVVYVAFALAPMNLVLLGVIAFMLFFLAAFIMLLMLVFQADTIEYGQWKLGQRNGAVTFALQPFINKVSAAMNTAIVSATVIIAGINSAKSAADVTPAGLWTLKVAMLIIPAVLVALGYAVWRRKFIINEALHARIVGELAERGDLHVKRPVA
jgi:melibiose permease/lactose/raffinose/galactose permease